MVVGCGGGACVPLALRRGTGHRLVFFNKDADAVQTVIAGGGSILGGAEEDWSGDLRVWW